MFILKGESRKVFQTLDLAAIGAAGVWRGCGPLAKTKRTAAKIAGDDVLIRAPELSSKVDGVASFIPQPVVDEYQS